eukprot:4568720-Lingulodinium_polyedra.AAC.1
MARPEGSGRATAARSSSCTWALPSIAPGAARDGAPPLSLRAGPERCDVATVLRSREPVQLSLRRVA